MFVLQRPVDLEVKKEKKKENIAHGKHVRSICVILSLTDRYIHKGRKECLPLNFYDTHWLCKLKKFVGMNLSKINSFYDIFDIEIHYFDRKCALDKSI